MSIRLKHALFYALYFIHYCFLFCLFFALDSASFRLLRFFVFRVECRFLPLSISFVWLISFFTYVVFRSVFRFVFCYAIVVRNRFAIAAQSPQIAGQSLHSRYAIAVQLLRNHCAIAVQALHNRIAIAL
jgi:hypothetical protein